MCGKAQLVITVGKATLPIRYTKLLQAVFTIEGATCKTEHFVGGSSLIFVIFLIQRLFVWKLKQK